MAFPNHALFSAIQTTPPGRQRSGQQRIAVLFQCDGQTLKPVCPLIAQMASDPDLINDWLTWIRFLSEFV